MRRASVQLAFLALAQLSAMTLWFSATAVLPALTQLWSLGPSGAAWMTAAVQVGFVAGALGSAIFNLPDAIPPRRLLAVSAIVGAASNLALAFVADGAALAIVCRFATGVALAGVYPPGMKIAAGHVSSERRGLAIAVLVAALTLGSATPHLVAAVGEQLPYRVVLVVSSGLAVLSSAIVLAVVRDGPFAPPPAPFDPRQIGRVLRDRPLLLANTGYFGHMWELYAMWAWLVAFLVASGVGEARLVAFVVIGLCGAVGAIVGGLAADRFGRTLVTVVALAISGSCCLAAPAIFVAPFPILLLVAMIWGASIVADSAQFSAAATELSEPHYMGTALTLQTSIGFAITLVPIWGLPYLAELVGWRWAFSALTLGPIVGAISMMRLRRRPEATKMASGRR